jgi:hypothetical protein
MSLLRTTTPGTVTQTSIEDVTLGVDCTAQLGGFAIAAATATLTVDGTPVTLEDTPQIHGNVVDVRIRAGVLQGGNVYQLTVLFNPQGTTNQLALFTEIDCPI